MTLNVRNPRFVVRRDDADEGFAWWSLEFDGREYAIGTHSAPVGDVYEFLRWLQRNIADIEIAPPEESQSQGVEGQFREERPGGSYG